MIANTSGNGIVKDGAPVLEIVEVVSVGIAS